MEKIYYVYVINNNILNKQYIGSKICYKSDPNNDGYWGSSKDLKKDFEKYGKENFSKTIIKDDYHDETSLLIGESEIIIKYNTLAPFGYNKVLPTNHMKFYHGGCVHTDESKKKISESCKKNKKLVNIRKTAFLGKTHSTLSKEKISKSLKGRVLSDETKKKMSIAKKGKSMSDSTKKKLSIINTGKGGPNKDKKFSDETKQKMSQARKGMKYKKKKENQ